MGSLQAICQVYIALHVFLASTVYTPTQSVGGWLLNREPTLVLDLEFCLTQSLSNTPLMVFRPIITFLLLWRFGLDPFVAILDPGKG